MWEPTEIGDPTSRITEQQLLPYCDEALTLAFSDRSAEDLRYCDAFGRWFEWNDGRWREDALRRVFTRSRQLCRDRARAALEQMQDEKAAARVTTVVVSARAVAAVVNLARADVRHATAEDWDRNAWILNTPAGLVDLRSGRLHSHDRSTLCSKITAVAPAEEPCPRWHRFLDEITAGDVDLQAFLCRVAGYALTGSTREHALFFFYGTGANGKGTFLNTLTGILGDYARIVSMETFTETSSDRHPIDLVGTQSQRLRRPPSASPGLHRRPAL